MQVKCMVCSASVTSLASGLPPKLPALLARDGLWKVSRAVGYSTRHPILLHRIEAQLALLNTPEVNWKMDPRDQDFLCSEILDGVGHLAETKTSMVRSSLIIDVLPHLRTPYFLERAVELANGLPEALFRLKTLASILPKIMDEQTALLLTEQIVQGCVNLDLRLTSAHEYLDYVPELYELVGQAISIVKLATIWRTIDTYTETGQANIWQNSSPKAFLDYLAWHLPGEKGEDFVDFLLAHSSLTLVGVRVLRLAARLDDRAALNVANKLYSQAQASPDSIRAAVIWSIDNEYKPAEGCGLAFIALAWDRQEITTRSAIVSVARQYIAVFGAREKPVSGGDLSTLCGLVEGTQLDSHTAALVRGDEFLDYFGKYSNGSSLPIYAEEVMRYVGPETIAALMGKAHLQKSWEIAQSPYLLANIAQSTPASALDTIFEYGPGRYEYIRIGYIRAAAQCIMRMQTAARVDSLKWILRLSSAPTWLLQSVGPYMQVHDLEDAELRERFIEEYKYVGPFVASEVGRVAVRAESYWESTRDNNRLILIQYHLQRDERLPLLQSLEQERLKISDSGQQLGLLRAFAKAGGWPVRRGLARALASSEELTYGKTMKFWRKLARPKQPIPWNTGIPERYSTRNVTTEDANYWHALRRKVEAINDLATLAARQQAIIDVHNELGAIVHQITNSAYYEYAKQAPAIWSALDASIVGEAVDMLSDTVLVGSHIESHDFVRTIIPPVTLFRKDLLCQLEEHIKNPYTQLKARQYSLLAFFLSGDEQLLYLQKSVAAFSCAEYREFVIPYILTEIAQYASSDLIPHLMQWIQQYPCTTPLKALATRITWTDEYLAIAYCTLRQVNSPLHDVMRDLAPYLNSKWMSSFITLLFERNDFREQYESYPYLLQSWLQMQPTDMFAVWRDVLHDMGRYRRDDALEQLNWCAPVAFVLGGTTGLIDAGNNVAELSSWWPMKWQQPKPVWRWFNAP
jgi:hypothetical protein